MKNIFDSHVHSENSADGHHSVIVLCERAVEKGLSGICVTDHCELCEYNENQYAARVEQSVFDINKAKRVFNGRLSVSCGIELSDTLHDEAQTDRVIAKYPFDMIMISQHAAQGGRDIFYEDFKTWTTEQIHTYLNFYFNYLLLVAQKNKFDTLAHLTYPLRYITGRDGVSVDMTPYEGIIDEILRTVAQNKKAIELNTSGLWQALGDTLPPFAYIKRFRELGGEYVTIGSDSHKADTLGDGILSGMQILAKAGFTKYTIYKERTPLQLDLELI